MSADGAAYTATLKDDAFTLAPDSYMMISFWLKTSRLKRLYGRDGQHPRDGRHQRHFPLLSLDLRITTVDIDKVTDTGEIEEEEDIYQSWQQLLPVRLQRDDNGEELLSDLLLRSHPSSAAPLPLSIPDLRRSPTSRR